MYKKLISVAALGLALAACDCGNDKDANAMNDYTFQGNFEPGSCEEFKHTVGDRIFFATNSSNITAEANATLDKQTAWFAKNTAKKATIEGHCDERGTSEFNMALGERRADATRKAMVKRGMDNSRLSAVSYGKERPDVMGNDEAAWAKNRRAVVVCE